MKKETTISIIKDSISKMLTDRNFEIFILVLILLNTVLFAFESDANFDHKHKKVYYILQIIFVGVFTVEYLLRLLTIKKLSDIFKPFMLIDLLAILPYYLFFANITILRLFRLVKLFQFMKISRYLIALKIVFITLKKNRWELISVGFFYFLSMTFFTLLMYSIEQHHNQAFGSVYNCMYWAVITFTGVGYGDVVPVSYSGKLISSLAAITGLCLNGILIGILGASFLEVFQRYRKGRQSKARVKNN